MVGTVSALNPACVNLQRCRSTHETELKVLRKAFFARETDKIR
jgi:hypothetical protein